ncbi:C-X-C chemokine receptor type 3-like isoform X2 [Megalops cyprinoides]|nr:C-X-C chemokine receptor type 3-like isoform X2 [Megalops cyprinoides]XP_036394125.1 C-X-C chemokine receptor type 3-like isoform X2 [Megalops cyprinoides]
MEVDLDGLFVHNTTFDYENYETPEDECTASNHLQFEAVLIPILYSLALVLGLLGNGLVLGVLCRLQRSWSVTDTFILHLTVADTLLLLTLPFWAVGAAQGWSFGGPSCKLIGAIFKINFYCGIFLLGCISLDRYLSIVHAMQIYSCRKPWAVQASCLCVWIFCLLLSIPDWVFLEPVAEPRRGGKAVCTHNYLKFNTSAKDWRMASRLLYHVVGFVLPSLVMVFCYSCILLRLNRGSQGPQKLKAIRVILALVVVFFVSWTPFNITLIADTLRSKGDFSGACKSRAALDVALVVTTALACVHACLNPVLYSCLCSNFRHHLLDMLGWRSRARADHELSLWDQPEDSVLQHSEEMGQLNPPKSTEQTQLSLTEQKSSNGISS